jgi:hypothetical protein
MKARAWSMRSGAAWCFRFLQASPSKWRTGFSLFMLKAIMGGRADELIDLPRTNLWQ